jgi:hypothetical protein
MVVLGQPDEVGESQYKIHYQDLISLWYHCSNSSKTVNGVNNEKVYFYV